MGVQAEGCFRGEPAGRERSDRSWAENNPKRAEGEALSSVTVENTGLIGCGRTERPYLPYDKQRATRRRLSSILLPYKFWLGESTGFIIIKPTCFALVACAL